MDCLKAPEGCSFVQLDFASLEPHVLAHTSGCPTYREIYASGKPHDPYFFITCKLLDKTGELSRVYQIDNPTKESVKAAKKQFKKQRDIGKVFQLKSTYKAGAASIHRGLVLDDIDITRQEVEANREKYWGPDLFGKVLEYEEHMLAQVDQRDGWLMNTMGRPIVVLDHKRKDVLNIDCQSTGHDITDILILKVEERANQLGIKCWPVIPDYHDETIWMCATQDASTLAECMKWAVTQVNNIVRFSVQLKGDPEITKTFTEFKQPDAPAWYMEKTNE